MNVPKLCEGASSERGREMRRRRSSWDLRLGNRSSRQAAGSTRMALRMGYATRGRRCADLPPPPLILRTLGRVEVQVNLGAHEASKQAGCVVFF